MSLGRLAKRLTQIDSEADRAFDADVAWSSLVDRVRGLIRTQLVPEQLALFSSTNRWDAACCARQCGKTYVAARLLIDTALGIPDSISVYVSDTWDNAVKVMWVDQEDGLPAVLEALGLIEDDHYRINLSSRTVTFLNGSVIELAGADRGAWAKFRGRKLNLVIADEMQRQHQDSLRAALTRDLPDCFNVRRGRFVGLGTVGRAPAGIWFEVNAATHGLCPHPPGWNSFHWTARELQHLTNAWSEQLAYAQAMGIDITTDPEWLREKEAIWVRDSLALVHALTPQSVWNGELPDLIRTRCPEHGHMRGRCRCTNLRMVPRADDSNGEMQHYAGFDFGGGDSEDTGDPCAIVVGSISREEGILREVHSQQFHARDSDHIRDVLVDLRSRFGIRRFYLDPAWKLSVKDLKRIHGLDCEAATKGNAEGTDEDFWYSERRSAINQGTMQFLEGSPLHGQMQTVLRDEIEMDRGHVRAKPGQDDHCYDAWRYLFRMVRTRHVEAPEPPLDNREAVLRDVAEIRARSLSTGTERRPPRGEARSVIHSPRSPNNRR